MTPAQRRISRIWGVGMVAATALYVGLGYGLDLWKQAAPIVYTVAACRVTPFTIASPPFPLSLPGFYQIYPQDRAAGRKIPEGRPARRRTGTRY